MYIKECKKMTYNFSTFTNFSTKDERFNRHYKFY